jgi:pyruvate dehydrogenase E1 component beta subunit
VSREITYAEALREALDYCLEQDPDVYVMGLGVPDPKGVFGSTVGLQNRYGPRRVFDIPLSENALTGVALGSAICGMRPVLVHQRVDFALTSFEQLVNQVSKWHYMFNGQMAVPMVVRMVVGRGWGQGPQHSQSLQALFAHIPGFRVIMPTTPHDAKGMLIAAIEDDNPVICLEHRWLYGVCGHVPEGGYRVDLNTASVVRPGTDVTLIGVSYMTVECLAASLLLEEVGISAEVVDLRSIRPLDVERILESLQRTGRVLTVDNAHVAGGMSAEISAVVSEFGFDQLKVAPQRLGFPDYPTPTSPALADRYYPLPHEIASKCAEMLGRSEIFKPPDLGDRRLDQPNATYHGPF